MSDISDSKDITADQVHSTLKNPNVSDEAKEDAKQRLDDMA